MLNVRYIWTMRKMWASGNRTLYTALGSPDRKLDAPPGTVSLGAAMRSVNRRHDAGRNFVRHHRIFRISALRQYYQRFDHAESAQRYVRNVNIVPVYLKSCLSKIGPG